MAQIPCFQCEETIGIHEKVCPYCGAEQRLAPKTVKPAHPGVAPSPAAAAHPHPDPHDIPSSAPHAQERPHEKNPPHEKSGQKKSGQRETVPEKPEQEHLEQKTSTTPPHQTTQTTCLPAPAPSDEGEVIILKPHKKKRQKKPAGCAPILAGLLLLLIAGFVFEVILTDEKEKGIPSEGPGLYGRLPTAAPHAATTTDDIDTLIATIQAYRRRGQLEKAYQIAQQALPSHPQNSALLVVLTQVAWQRNEEAGQGTTGTNRRTTPQQRAKQQDFNTAAALLLNQKGYRCQKVMTAEKKPGRPTLTVGCPAQNGFSTDYFTLDLNTGTIQAIP